MELCTISNDSRLDTACPTCKWAAEDLGEQICELPGSEVGAGNSGDSEASCSNSRLKLRGYSGPSAVFTLFTHAVTAAALSATVEDMCIGGINVDAALLGVELIN